MARTAGQDEELNNLYDERGKMEDSIRALPENRADHDYPGWVDLDNKIEAIVNPPPVSEEERLKNIIESCNGQLKSEPGNLWWMNYRDSALERLGEIYQAEHGGDMDDWADDVLTHEDWRISTYPA